jgi:hypothetical protein
MEPDIELVIINSPNRDTLAMLARGEFDGVLARVDKEQQIGASRTQERSALHYFAQFYRDYQDDLRGLRPPELNWELPFPFAIEMVRILYALRGAQVKRDLVNAFGARTLNTVARVADIIQQKANSSPEGSPIEADIWMAGASLREWIQLLADFFQLESDLRSEAEARYQKAKISSATMAGHPHVCAPDLVSAALCLERLRETAQAKSFYVAVVTDMFSVAQDCEAQTVPPNDESLVVLRSLIEACEGLKRIEPPSHARMHQIKIDEIKAVLKRCKKN